LEYTKGCINNDDSVTLMPQYYRLLLVDKIRLAMVEMNIGNPVKAKTIIDNLIKEIKNSEVNSDIFIIDLLKDLTDQVEMALSKSEFYNRWGKDYLPSLMGAHLNQQCNNFKDASVQHYGGKLFLKLRDTADDTFCKLPPPKPSITGITPTRPLTSMTAYNNASNGCIYGDCTVLMANGSKKNVKEIRKDDFIMSTNGVPAKVSCVVKYNCYGNKIQLVEIKGGLLITPWHPVKIDNKWQFPTYLGKITEKSCPAVYNFVLETKHIIIINGVECVTLGHQFEEEVVQHSYFGTNRIIIDLQKLDGWKLGFIELTKDSIVRDKKKWPN